MELITKQYIVDENNRKIAVQIPIEDFEKIERLLEDYALFLKNVRKIYVF